MRRVQTRRFMMLLLLVLAVGSFAACHKKVAVAPPAPVVPPPPPPPPPPAPPTITITANPGTINRGQSATITWQATNATTVNIDGGVGQVAANGNRQVTPDSTVRYTARAVGPGGEATNSALITVNTPPPPPAPPTPRPPTPPPAPDISLLFTQNVRTILFDYDKSDIKADQVSVLQGNATWLKANPNVRFTIEGHCDERGSEEYNLALGDRRATAIRQYLVSQGVAESRIMTQSFGEERPVCRDATEQCYMMNRRGAFVMTR